MKLIIEDDQGNQVELTSIELEKDSNQRLLEAVVDHTFMCMQCERILVLSKMSKDTDLCEECFVANLSCDKEV